MPLHMTAEEFYKFNATYYGAESPFDLELMADVERRRSQLENECADFEREEQRRADQAKENGEEYMPNFPPLSRQELVCVDGSSRGLELTFVRGHIPTLVVNPIQEIIRRGRKGRAMDIIMKPKIYFTYNLQSEWVQDQMHDRAIADRFKIQLESLGQQHKPISVNKMVCFVQPASMDPDIFHSGIYLKSHYDNLLLISNIAYALENQPDGRPLSMYFFWPPWILSRCIGELRNRALTRSGRTHTWEQVDIVRAFQEIDQHTIVVIINPSIPVRQILCDMSPGRLPKAILCTKVNMTQGYYPDEAISDPLSPQVQGIFATYYTGYDLHAGYYLYTKTFG